MRPFEHAAAGNTTYSCFDLGGTVQGNGRPPVMPGPRKEALPAQPENEDYCQPPLLQPNGERPSKNRPLVVLWDETHFHDTRLAWPPDELFKKTCHPNVVLFHLHMAGECSFRLREQWRKFRAIGWFVVSSNRRSTSCYGVGSLPIFTSNLNFLGLYQRGKMIPPAIAPSQIVRGGFPGVIRLVEAMWPKRRRVLISSLEEAPPGWELYTSILPPLEDHKIPKERS